MANTKLLKVSLLITRIFVVWMMSIWALARVRAEEAPAFVSRWYESSSGLPIGAIPHGILGYILLVIYILMLIGVKKKITYFLVFAVHLTGTLLVIKLSLPFLEGFRTTWFTSWPALMAMWLLWVMREEDTLLTLKGKWS